MASSMSWAHMPHYFQELEGLRPRRSRLTLVQRLCRDIILGPDCWEWRGQKLWSGYGRFFVWAPGGGGKRPAHRVAYELFIGPVPAGLDLDHLCRNRGCVNPDHLEPVTRRTNLLRGNTIPARKARQTHCCRGHEFNAANTKLRPNGTRFCLRCYDLRNPARA